MNELILQDVPHPLTIASYQGQEAINELGGFEIRAYAPFELEAKLAADKIAGCACRFPLAKNHGESYRGVVAGVEIVGVDASRADAIVLQLDVVPHLQTLEHSRTSRIFQDKTIVAMVDAVLETHGVPRRWQLERRYPARTYCVQYQETDLAFVTRMLAEEGIFFWLDHRVAGADEDMDAAILVLTDTPEATQAIPGQRTLHFNATRTGVTSETQIHSFRARRELRPREVLLRDFDFKRPRVEMVGRSRVKGAPVSAVTHPPGRIYEHRVGYEEPDLVDTVASVELDQIRHGTSFQLGDSYAPQLRPGRRFQLNNHPVHALDDAYYVVRVVHKADYGEVHGAEAPKARYSNEFVTTEATTAHRPPRPHRILRQVTETATVVGPANEEVYADEHARVKVQFHWDLDGRRNEDSSCWLRVAHPWAGSSWGFQFIPRVGMEVVVTFVGGDLDRPLITGSVYNAENPPAYLTAAELTRSGIRTRSTPGGDGYNELSFNDLKGSEQVRLRAERNLDEAVLVDHATHVGNNQTLAVDANQSTVVGGSQVIHVAKSRSLSVEGVEQTRVGLDRSDATGGDYFEDVTGNAKAQVGGNDLRFVIGSSTLDVEEDYGVRVRGSATTQIGSEEIPGGADTYAFGSYAIGAGETISLRAQRRIVLQCGESSIDIGPDEIRIGSPKVRTVATKLASMQTEGPSIALTGQMDLAAKELNLYGEESFLSLSRKAILKAKESTTLVGGGAGVGLSGNAIISGQEVKAIAGAGATMVLNADANLDGALVKLNCGGGGGGVGAEDKDPEALIDLHVIETKPLVLRVLDSALEPMKLKQYVLAVGGERYDGRTSGDGQLQHRVPKEATSGQLTVWPGEYPEGPRLQWKVVIETLPPPESVPGARIRLSNLAYYNGPPVEEIDERLRKSIRMFQRNHELRETGELDPVTVAKLRERHGH